MNIDTKRHNNVETIASSHKNNSVWFSNNNIKQFLNKNEETTPTKSRS